MTTGDEVFRQIQGMSRSIATKEQRRGPTAELLTRHALESFLDRLVRTVRGQDFVRVEEIREASHHPGLRVRIVARLSTQSIPVTWDISHGDPIIPAPCRVWLPRVIGADIEMWGYAPETVIAEKAVTILERGISSTRWRDYVDIVQLASSQDLDLDSLSRAAAAVARYRAVELRPIAHVVAGYGAVSQAKWAAWRRKEGLEGVSEGRLDDQMLKVAAVVDGVFGREWTD